MGFYEELEEHYDDMTRFEDRLKREDAVVSKWIETYKFQSVLDVACGTGLYSILLAKKGLSVTGVDISDTMIEKASFHASENSLPVKFIKGSMENLTEIIDNTFDCILCLGNSIPHILKKEGIEGTLNNFYSLLNPGGIAVIQLLNYHKVYEEKERIVGIHKKDNIEYIRFYDLDDDSISFNILIVTWKDDKASYSLHKTVLYPYRKEELEEMLVDKGFSSVDFYGDMNFNPFVTSRSTNLVIVAKK